MKLLSRTHRLTEYARKKLESCTVAAQSCTINSIDDESAAVVCNISRKSFIVQLPADQQGAGSKFGACTCGTPEKDYFPCEHIVTFSQKKNYSEYEIIPIEYQTRTYREQYPSTLVFRGVLPESAKSNPPDKCLRYIPAAPKKAGRPRTRRARSVLERSRKRLRLCSKCSQAGHTAPKCTMQLEDDPES